MNVPLIPLERADIRPGDVLVHWAHRPDGSAVSRLSVAVAEIGRGEASHCAMADRLPDGTRVAIEMVPPEGWQVALAPRVRKLPGVVHWLAVPNVVALDYTASGHPIMHCYDRLAAVHRMRQFIGVRYGFETLLRDYLASSWARWITRMPANDDLVDWQPVCSMAVLEALQVGFGGWDLVRNLNTACAQPEDVNRIAFLGDRGALIP